ncbi:MAG: DUF2147 domain-containing protein [Oligoflexales bacterium]
MMKFHLMVTIFFSFYSCHTFAHEIEGNWLAPSTEYHPAMIIRLSINHHILYGQVQWVDEKDQRFGKPARCLHCRRSDQNKSLQNLVMLWGFRKAHDSEHLWTYGKALSPRNGKTYMSSLTQTKKDQLDVNVYWGLPFFGEKFHWSRANTKNIAFLDHQYRRTYDDKNNIFKKQNKEHHLCSKKNFICKKYFSSPSASLHNLFSLSFKAASNLESAQATMSLRTYRA